MSLDPAAAHEVGTVRIVGTGLLGASVSLGLSSSGARVLLADASPTALALARDLGAGTPDGAGERVDLVVVATPPDVTAAVVLEELKAHPDAVVTDVASVKAGVLAALRAAGADLRTYVGGHPMAGASRSGWAAGSADLFAGAPWAVSTDEGSDTAVWAQVAQLALDCRAHVVPAAAADHDAAVARVSHLPHLLAAVLASVGADGGPLALALGAGSFTDGTRVASSPPDLVQAMCEGNRSALLAAVDDALGRLGAARGSLASTGGLAATIRAGHLARRAFDAACGEGCDGGTLQVDLAAADALARLREIGRAGGRVIALNGTLCTCTR